MTYFVTRKPDGTLKGIHPNHMPGYNDEELPATDPEVVAFLAAAAKITVITYEEFQTRFTAAEFNAATDFIYASDLLTGKPKNRELIQGLSRAIAKNSVDLLAARTAAFMDALVTGGIIAAQRKTEILTP